MITESESTDLKTLGLISQLQGIARRYIELRDREKLVTAAKREIRDACVAVLKELETEAYSWEVDDKRFRAVVYPITRVVATEKLANLLESRNLGHLVKRVLKVEEGALVQEIRRGTLTVEEVQAAATIETSEGFRITEIIKKNDIEDDVEVHA